MDASRTRDVSPDPVGFIGDLADPWVVGIADAIAAERPVDRVPCDGTLPDRPFGAADPPRAVVVHRHALTASDADRLHAWRARSDRPASAVILCISPYVRYEELERCSSLVDMVVSEAMAAEVLPGRLARRLDGDGRRRPAPDKPVCRIEVAGGDGELGRALVDACSRAGYATTVVDDPEIGDPPHPGPRDRRRSPRERVLTIWEVPILEADWAHRLECRAHQIGPVIALAGFADRAVVTRARDAGAAACLELPCDIDDLIDVVNRVVSRTHAEAWPIPGRAEPPHVLPPPRRNPRSHRQPSAPSPWPDREATPTIP